MNKLEKLKSQLEKANNKYSQALKKPYFTYSEQMRVAKQVENWSNKIDELEMEISELESSLSDNN